MIRIFPFILAAGETRSVAASGEYFEIRDSAYPIYVELLDRSGGVVTILEDARQSDFVKPGLYETIRVTNGPLGQTVKFFVGSGDAGSRRVSGDVSVIDGEKNRTLGGGMFAGIAVCGNGTVNYSNSQIWNPLGTGKNLIISSASAALYGGSGAVNYWMTSVQLNTAAVNPPGNKKAGGPNPVALLRQQLSAGELTQLNPALRNETLPSTTSIQWSIRGALVVPPGFGLNVSSQVTNFSLNADFEWFEEQI